MAAIATEITAFPLGEPIITPADRLGMTFFYAVVAHAIIVLGIVFVPDDRVETRYSTLDIVLVQSRSEKAPDDVDFLAQANQEGGGNSDEKSRPATPLPSPLTSLEPTVATASPPIPLAPPAPQVRPRPDQPPSPAIAQAKTVIAVIDRQSTNKVVTAAVAAPRPKAKPTPSPTPPESTSESRSTQSVRAATLVQRSLAMASLSAEIDQRLEAYAEWPRRMWINAKTHEYKYATYMEAWRLKVERIGNLNYPDEARRRQLSGSLLLEVVLNGNGSVNDIVLRRSSGHRVLDDAAIRIVKLAAPYAPLPQNILEDTDLLHIERTWRFLSTNRFAGG